MSHFKKAQKGRTMLEMLMVLAMIGILTLGGYAGIRYGFSIANAWTVQQQVTDLSKGVESLYAWETDYRNISMSGTRGICANLRLGEQQCNYETFVFSSPWGGKIDVRAGQSASSYRIVYTDVPKTVCKQLQNMKWKSVYMQANSCDSAIQSVVFSAEKSDDSCNMPCPGDQVCRNGACICANGGLGESCVIQDRCPGMTCTGECYTGECKDSRCVQKVNGTACSNGVCRFGSCEVVTDPPEENECPASCTSRGNVCDQGVCVNPGCTKDNPLANGSSGYCNPCSSEHNGYVQVSADQCSVCSNRELIMGYCVIPCGENAPLQSESGYCKTCNDEYAIDDPLDKCKLCPNRQRIFEYGAWKCVLAFTVTEDETTTEETVTEEETTTETSCDYAHIGASDGTCYHCSDPLARDVIDCSACDGTSWPRTLDKSEHGQCALVTCPFGKFRDERGSCYACSDTGEYRIGSEGAGGYWARECVPNCQGTAYPRSVVNRSGGGVYCVLDDVETTTEEITTEEVTTEAFNPCGWGRIMDSFGTCRNCADLMGFMAQDCNVCSETSYPRTLDRAEYGQCALETCPYGNFQDANGNCLDCSDPAKHYVGETNGPWNPECEPRCRGTGYPRMIIYEYGSSFCAPSDLETTMLETATPGITTPGITTPETTTALKTTTALRTTTAEIITQY